MRRAILALLLVSLPAGADDALDRKVAGLAAELGSDDAAKRDAALTALGKLGLKAEKAVRAEIERATDPEVKGRLQAALQMYGLEEEDLWALAQIRKGEPFPKSKEGCDRVRLTGGVTVRELVANVAEQSGVKIEFYAADPDLPALLDIVTTMGSMDCSGADAARNALWNLLSAADVAFVVDGDRVVIVRQTPAVLFEGLGHELDNWSLYWIATELRDFEKGRFNFWLSSQRFVQEKAKNGGAPRERWFELLRNRALDPAETDTNRAMALLGLSKFFGVLDTPQPDVEAVFAKLAGPGSPAAVRRWAARGLTWGMSEESQEAVLGALEGNDAELQHDVLEGLFAASGFCYATLTRIEGNEKHSARLKAALAALSASKTATLAAEALVFRAWRKEPEAQAALAGAELPADPRLQLYFLHSLFVADAPAAHRRFLEFAGSKDARLRAAFGAILASYAGGKDRVDGAAALLKALSDPEPIVRNFAAAGLGSIYCTRSSVPFTEGKEAAVARLKEFFEKEQDARVREATEYALKQVGP